MSRPRSWAPYMTWSKRHPRAPLDLTGSNLLPCTLADLPGARERVDLWGPNDEGYVPLVQAIADRYGTTPDGVATAAGASGANFLALAALLRPGDHVLVETPGYDPHLGAARLLGAEVGTFRRCFEDDFALDPDRLRAAMRPRTRAIVLTRPHNPSGVLPDLDALDEIGGLALRAGARVIVDEVYLDASSGDDRAPAALRSDAFVSTNSLTKSYGLSGLRIGWALAAPDIVEAMARVRDVVDVAGSFPSDRLATLAFDRLDALLERAHSILDRNNRAVRAFVESRQELSWTAPAGGAVAFPRLKRDEDAEPFVAWALREHDVGVVPGRFFGSPEHFRIAMGGAPERLVAGLAALGSALDAWC